MVGQRPLEPFILVRIQVPEPTQKSRRMPVFALWKDGGFIQYSGGMKQELLRARSLRSGKAGVGPVAYWMDRDMRVRDNWALYQAQATARTRSVPLVVVYHLIPNYLGGGRRQWEFKVRALQEVARDLEAFHIPFFLIVERPEASAASQLVQWIGEHKIGEVITDFSPLRGARACKADVASSIDVPLIEVDAHNLVPAWVLSDHQEFAAYTLRPKVHRLAPEWLVPVPPITRHPVAYSGRRQTIDWDALLADPAIPMTPPVAPWAVPGEAAAHRMLQTFLDQGLSRYAEDRNDPLAFGQSNLSPYLHFGQIAPARVALAVLECVGRSLEVVLPRVKNAAAPATGAHLTLIDQAAAFLEELIVRRELAENFCLYQPAYDRVEGFPAWAQETLHAHRQDTRPYVYSPAQFEAAATHDDLWNAAQRELLQTGKMHGYLRMYWAKKLLEWSPSPEEALATAIALNDAYELDGRDPNGYAGIAWSIGGVHDRAWFPRPIFGTVRYMARSGCEKRFDVEAYIRRYSS